MTWNDLFLLINLIDVGGKYWHIFLHVQILNKNQFFAVKRMQLFKQKLISSRYKDHVNNRNLKSVWYFHVKA